MQFVKRIFGVPVSLVKRVNDFSRRRMRGAWVIWISGLVLLLALVGLFIAVPSSRKPTLGLLDTLVSAAGRLLGVLMSAVAGLLGTLVSTLSGLLSTLLNAIARFLAASISTLVELLPFAGVAASLFAVGYLLVLIWLEEEFDTWRARTAWAACLLISVIIFIVSIDAVPGMLPFAGVAASLFAMGYLVVLIWLEEGFDTWRARTAWAACLLISVIIFIVSISAIPRIDLLNAIATLVGAFAHSLISLLPFIGAITSLSAIALMVYLLFTRRREWNYRDEQYKTVVCIVGLFIALAVLIISIPGLVGSTVSLVGGILTALVAFIGAVFSYALQAYTAWSSQNLETNRARRAAEEEAEKERLALEAPRREAEKEHESMQESVLHERIAEIYELLSGGDSGGSEKADQEIAMVKAKILMALLRIEKKEKGILLQFLYDTTLIKTEHTAGRNQALHNIQLSGADLSETELHMANLSRANLSDVFLNGARLVSADLSEANLRNTNLSKADLNGANLRETNLSGADLSHADLNGADLSWADLSGANLRETNLSGTDLSHADLSGVSGVIEGLLSRRASNVEGAIMPDGSINPGRYATRNFEPTISFEVDEKWQFLRSESTDEVYIRTGPEEGELLIFTSPLLVFSPSNLSEPRELSKSDKVDQLVSWFQSHPNLQTSKPVPVSVGSASGKQIDVTCSSTPETYPQDICGEEPCVPLYQGSTSESINITRDGWKDRFIILDIRDDLVVIDVAAPTHRFEEFLPKAQRVLETVKWEGT